MFLTAIVGAGQIADDMRSHAFEVYLARPIRGFDYLLGKLLTVVRPLLLVTLAPAILLLVISHVLIPDSFSATVGLYPKAAIAALVLSFVNAAAILGISALGKSARYASIIWFALNLGSFAAYTILINLTQDSRFEVVSYAVNHYIVGKHILDVEELPSIAPINSLNVSQSPWLSLMILAVISFLGIWAVMRRVRAGRLP
jgi:hypothetical protein